MSKVSGGELFVQTLKKAGIDTVYTLHGGHLDAIYQACIDHNIRVVDTRHEAAAGHCAEAHAKTTGQPGIAMVTAGPGFANVLTAIVDAWLDCTPVVFIAGSPPLRDAETNPLQGGFSQVAMAAPVTKWSHQITQTHRIPHLLAHALRIAASGRPGPVFLDLPIDVLFSQVNAAGKLPETIIPDAPSAPTPEQVGAALAVLRTAKRPVIMAGGGCWFSQAGAELTAFAHAAGIPVYTNNRAHGLIPTSDPLACKHFANLAALAGDGGERPDCVLLLGARLGLFTGGQTDDVLPYDIDMVHVDIDAREFGRIRDVDVAIAADCRETLAAFNRAGGDWPDWSAWAKRCKEVSAWHRHEFGEALDKTTGPVHPYQAASLIAEVAGDDMVLVADGGETHTWFEMVAQVNAGGRFLTMGYLGCLGVGMPFAVAAQVAHPDRRVICVVGDGAVGLNIQEFDTMVRHNLPVVVVVFNNKGWGMSVHGQQLMFGKNRLIATELAGTHYHDVAAGFGCHGEYVETPAELKPALERALASGKPACVNVMVDMDVIAPFTLALLGNWDREAQIALPYYANIEA